MNQERKTRLTSGAKARIPGGFSGSAKAKSFQSWFVRWRGSVDILSLQFTAFWVERFVAEFVFEPNNVASVFGLRREQIYELHGSSLPAPLHIDGDDHAYRGGATRAS
jgi:hypothetical protein